MTGIPDATNWPGCFGIVLKILFFKVFNKFQDFFYCCAHRKLFGLAGFNFWSSILFL
jgi:hypothetical protein